MSTRRPRGSHGRDHRVGRGRRILLSVLVFVLPFAIVEGTVRILIATDRLPDAPAHLRDFEISWENLKRLGRADVIVFGDSVAQQGIDPARLAGYLAAGLGRKVTVFNLASADGSFGINATLAEQLAREGRLPRVALIAIQPGILRDDLALHDIFAPSPMGAELTRCTLARTYDERMSCIVGQVSAAWRWRGNLDRVLKALAIPAPTTSQHGGLMLREDGFRQGRGSTEFQLEAQLAENLPITPLHLQLGADAAAAYARLVAIFKRNGVRIITVAVPNVPLLQAALERRNPDWEAEYQSAISQLVTITGVAVVAPAEIRDWTPFSSRNIKHLSKAGAAAFVDELWSFPSFRDGLMTALEAADSPNQMPR